MVTINSGYNLEKKSKVKHSKFKSNFEEKSKKSNNQENVEIDINLKMSIKR